MNNVKTTDNKCYFSLTKDGKPIKIQRQIFSECFYVMAMSEMYRVLQDDIYKVGLCVDILMGKICYVKVDSTLETDTSVNLVFGDILLSI